MSYCISPWIPIVVVSFVLIKYVLSCFDRVKFIWVLKFFFGKKSKSVFTYRSMIEYSSQDSSVKQIRMFEEPKPWSFFGA